MKRASYLNEIAYMYNGTWYFRYWYPCLTVGKWYRKSTFGHYYTDHWHPLAVEQNTYVMDDFGNLVLVYGDKHIEINK